MQYVTDLNEIFKILSECCGKPVYTDIGADENGNRICVPMFAIGGDETARKEDVRA